VLARDNGLDSNSRLQPGQALLIDNRHIIPKQLEDGILINLPQRMLFLLQGGSPVVYYPVGLGKPDWSTPTGEFTVLVKEENPTWDVPISIQEEMRREGKAVKTKVPPGPDNPLGKYWLGLSLSGLGIHGTIAPTSIYQFRSHGCIRLHPDDITAFFPLVSDEQEGEIIYAPVLLAQLDDGRIFLEVHRDIYKKGGDPLKRVQKLSADAKIDDQIDWQWVQQVVQRKEGVAREVGIAAINQKEVIE
ncbi:MAG: L,D-transpeptidase, partial [Gammaproteobacteria bacterium]